MNRILAFLFFMLFLAGVAFVMLKGMRPLESAPATAADAPENTTLISGDWQPVPDGSDDLPDSFVRFEVDGRISGFGGCNSFFGNYVATDVTLAIGPIGATRKACGEPVMRHENNVIRSLEAATEYRISGRTLTLSDPDRLLLTLVLRDRQTGL